MGAEPVTWTLADQAVFRAAATQLRGEADAFAALHFTPSEAARWANLGYTASEAAFVVNNGVSVADAEYWQRRGVDGFAAVGRHAAGWSAAVDRAHDAYMHPEEA